MKQTSIHIFVPKLRFCKYDRLPRIQCCKNAERPQPINYVKSSLCMFSPCYVRKPYALFPQETLKTNDKTRQGKNEFTRISPILKQKQTLPLSKGTSYDGSPPTLPPEALMMTHPMFLV